VTHYELDVANPGGPPSKTYSFPDTESLEAMQDDIRSLREQADDVVVALHKGVAHLPAVLKESCAAPPSVQAQILSLVTMRIFAAEWR